MPAPFCGRVDIIGRLTRDDDVTPARVWAARRVIAALVAIDILGLVLAALGVGGVLSGRWWPYYLLGACFEIAALTALWFLSHAAWRVLLVLNALGVVSSVVRFFSHPSVRHAVTLALAFAYTALLLLPQLRRPLRTLKEIIESRRQGRSASSRSAHG